MKSGRGLLRLIAEDLGVGVPGVVVHGVMKVGVSKVGAAVDLPRP